MRVVTSRGQPLHHYRCPSFADAHRRSDHTGERDMPSVDLPRESFELGDRRTMLEPLGPAGQGRKLRWIVRAAAGTKTTVTLWTERAGEASATVTFRRE